MFYDRLYNLPEGPPADRIIENDALLDNWIKEYNLEQKRKRTGDSGKPKSAKDHRSVISFKTEDQDAG